jgi:hypothetical protein
LEEFTGFNINRAHRPRMTEEGIEIIQGAWTQDKMLQSIRLFAEEVMPHLRPLQTPAKAA